MDGTGLCEWQAELKQQNKARQRMYESLRFVYILHTTSQQLNTKGNQNINTEPTYQYTSSCDLFTCMRHPNTPIQLRVVSCSAWYCLLLVEQSFDLSSSFFVTLFIACDVCLCDQCTSLVLPSKTRTGVGGYIDTD